MGIHSDVLFTFTSYGITSSWAIIPHVRSADDSLDIHLSYDTVHITGPPQVSKYKVGTQNIQYPI